ncbi:NAD(P)-binding protein [Aspergillus recurvatus]
MGIVTSRFSSPKLPLPPSSAVGGKVLLITDADTGLGREAARHALSLGATVILGVRSITEGEKAKAALSKGCVGGTVYVWPVDFESFASVQAFADRVKKYVGDGGRVDFAIINSGVASADWATATDRWERGLQANVLSTALLSLEILPLLIHSKEEQPWSKPCLTIVASDIHKSAQFRERKSENILSALNNQEQWRTSQSRGGATERYAVTKLLDIYLAKEIARIVPRKENDDPLVVVNCVASGYSEPWVTKTVENTGTRTVDEAGKTLLHAVTQGPESHGEWLEDLAIGKPGGIVTDPENVVIRQKLWTEILAVLKGVDPELRTKY